MGLHKIWDRPVLLNGYVSYFATNFMMIPIATVGIIFLIAKIFDGFTDLIAGYLIDRTHTKLGKARPYELGMIGYWGCTVALFFAPEMGQTASIIYLFAMYTLINSVFNTMIMCNDSVYLVNTGVSSEQAVSLSSFSGIVTMLFSLFASVIVPQMVANMGTTREGWRTIAVILAVPMTLVGLIRFFVVKETVDNSEAKNDLSIKESVQLLAKNKYILLFSLYMLIANIGSNLTTNVNTYYYKYVFGDIGAASYGAVALISLILSIGLVPTISKKIGFQRAIRVTVLLGAIGYLVRLIDVRSLPVLIVSALLSSVGFATLFMFVSVYLMECMDYGEWKHGKRGEGILASSYGVTCKVGTAFGLGISGILMGWSGFDANLEVQSVEATNMIVALCTYLPAIMCVILYVTLRFYNLDEMKDKIQADLAARRERN